MAVTARDKSVTQGLAARVAEIAALPVQREKAELWRRLNSLERVRPMVILQNGTWHQTGDQIRLEAEEDWVRAHEWGLRATLYHWDHMRDDTVYEAVAYSPVVIRDNGMGIHTDSTAPDHVFGARRYNPIIAEGDDPARVTMPTVEVDWDETERLYQRYCDLYDGVLAVEKRGAAFHWFNMMDQFIEWRGIENAMVDMVDRPEWVHAWMERLTAWHESRLDQYEDLGVLSLNNGANGVGPGGLGFTDELPRPDFDGVHVRTADLWGHAATQIFSEVSPAMHEEFALRYERRLLDRFGLNGYGCCEPLDKKTDILWSIPRLRRVSMSPWIDPARGAQGLGSGFIFSFKPNPAVIGMEAWNEDLARSTLRDALEKTRGCVVEVIMKDLHECRREPQRMWAWVDMAMRLAEEFAE